MARNVGGLERGIRILLGAVLIALGPFHVVEGKLMVASYIVGAILLVTGLFAFCPAWSLLGINTCAAKGAKAGGPAR